MGAGLGVAAQRSPRADRGGSGSTPLGTRRSTVTVPEWRWKEFEITTERQAMNVDVIHHFLALQSYWARGIDRRTVERSIHHSLCFGVLASGRQVGFARVISDYATVAYLGDVFVVQEFRGRGLGKWLMECVMSHPDLQ